MKNIFLTALIMTIAACSGKPVQPPMPVMQPLPKTLQEAVASDLRTPKNKERDQYRHPLETLEFFDVQPTQTVVEVYPGGGWYTEILAPYLKEQGHYVAAMGNKDINFAQNESLKNWVQKHPEAASNIDMVELSAHSLMIAEKGSADRVLTFRNVHNWMQANNEKKFFKAFFEVLKPGGILGVVEHRAGPKQKEKRGEKGYVSEKAVIAMAKAAGFKLVAKSEINANPKDTKNYPGGVWDLPPTLKQKDQNREKYLAIGESDRMMLKFIKPLK